MRGFERHHPGVVQTKQVAELGTARNIVDIKDGKRENIYVSDNVHETVKVDAKETPDGKIKTHVWNCSRRTVDRGAVPSLLSARAQPY